VTAAEAIILTLSPTRAVTAEYVAADAVLNINTVRTTLGTLVAGGYVICVGRETPSWGRPANLYKLARL